MKKAPPLWIRSILILSSTFVSFSHGSNDGQKGVGLMMIILIAIVPVKFSLNLSKDPAQLRHRSMVSGNGIKNLQRKTIASIGIAWIITIPATVLMAGLLFLLFRVILG